MEQPRVSVEHLLLVEVRELVRRGWTKGAYARNRSTWAPTTYDEQADFVDVAGAIEIVCTRHELDTSARELLRARVIVAALVEYELTDPADAFALEHLNDDPTVTKHTVLRWLDRAIEELA